MGNVPKIESTEIRPIAPIAMQERHVIPNVPPVDAMAYSRSRIWDLPGVMLPLILDRRLAWNQPSVVLPTMNPRAYYWPYNQNSTPPPAPDIIQNGLDFMRRPHVSRMSYGGSYEEGTYPVVWPEDAHIDWWWGHARSVPAESGPSWGYVRRIAEALWGGAQGFDEEASMKAERQATASTVVWDALEVGLVPEGITPNDICAISHDLLSALSQPVLLHGFVYDFDALVRWWVVNPTDPKNRAPFELRELKRIDPKSLQIIMPPTRVAE